MRSRDTLCLFCIQGADSPPDCPQSKRKQDPVLSSIYKDNPYKSLYHYQFTTCLYVLPLFLERPYLHSSLCQLLSSNFNSSAHLLCLDLISYCLELLPSSLLKEGGEKETISVRCRFQAGFHSISVVKLDREGHAVGRQEDSNRQSISFTPIMESPANIPHSALGRRAEFETSVAALTYNCTPQTLSRFLKILRTKTEEATKLFPGP